MSDDPFLAKLKLRAGKADTGSPAEKPSDKPHRSGPDRDTRAFWQSADCRAHIRRLIAGDESTTQAEYFATLIGDSQQNSKAVSLRGGDPKLELELLRLGACSEISIIDTSEQRLAYARDRIPQELREKVRLERVDQPLSYKPAEALGLVVANSALHRFDDPAATIAHLNGWLAPGGWVYVDEFVGPDRFQWSDAQLEIVNRLLPCLPEELRLDLAAEDERTKTEIGRPDPQRFSADNPSEAVAGSEIPAALDAHLEAVALRPYGGAVYHQLFARIMGNFVERPEVVRLILEFDAILTDHGVVESDYLWAAYRKSG